MELYKSSSDLNFNFVETFDANKNCETNGKCVIMFSDSYVTGSELDTMSHKHRNQANARERYRTHRYWFLKEFFVDRRRQVKRGDEGESWLIYQSSLFSVNSAFNTLRLLIPTEPKNRKLSKIETLRLAKSYISHLNASLTIGKQTNYIRKLSTNDLLSPLHFTLKEIHANLVLKQRMWIKTSSTIVQTFAHFVCLRSFIKSGLIRLKLGFDWSAQNRLHTHKNFVKVKSFSCLLK